MGGKFGGLAPLVCACLLLTSLPGSGAAQPDDVVVAVLDSGIFAEHETFRPGQVVAWYDFTSDDGSGVPDAVWDPAIQPYDDDGHGTAVAAMVGGSGPGQTASHAPGVSLAIGKVQDGGTTQAADLARAIAWAVHVVDADIISISQWWGLPWVGAAPELIAAIQDARQAGVLVVVLAGNAITPSWLHAPATSRHALVVGGAWADPSYPFGLAVVPDGTPTEPLSSAEPEVTARFFVKPPTLDCASCYSSHSYQGTSFAAPLVAGMAASLLGTARAAGLAEPGPDRLEALLKWAALDAPAVAPSLEGYGYLAAAELELAREHLLARTLPNANNPVKIASAAWVENAQPSLRHLGAGGAFLYVWPGGCCGIYAYVPNVAWVGADPAYLI